MDKNYCFVPQQGIDDVIADKIKELTGSKSNIWSQERVALLRGMYTEYRLFTIGRTYRRIY